MKIHNFRAGFATNSSSSHSIVLIPDSMIGTVPGIASGWSHYGWDGFRLVSEEDKLRYLCAQFFSSLRSPSDRENVRDLLAQHEPVLGEVEIDDPVTVDHQSVWDDCAAPTEAEIARLVKFFRNPRVVVLGGNDNDGPTHHYVGGQEDISFLFNGRGDRITKNDGDYIVAFNPKDGTKVRFSVDSAMPPYTKATTPELVDLKITNYCSAGCAFCYQASTEKGKHAPLVDIKRHIDMLAELGVFEIAIGGGEPTEHPDLPEILRYTAEKKIVPNITTYTGAWMDNVEVCDAIADYIGGVGVSVHSVKDLELVEKIETKLDRRKTKKNPYGRHGIRVTAQHVVGSTFMAETGAVLSAAFENRFSILLLGYKDVGFGKKFGRYDDAHTAVALRLAIEGKATAPVSVDTALVDRYPDLISALGVPSALVTSPEGKFSCYIDAVANRMGPSSYVEPKTLTTVPQTVDEFKTIFATY